MNPQILNEMYLKAILDAGRIGARSQRGMPISDQLAVAGVCMIFTGLIGYSIGKAIVEINNQNAQIGGSGLRTLFLENGGR